MPDHHCEGAVVVLTCEVHIAKRVEGVNPTESLWDSSQRGGSTIDGLVGQMKQHVRRTRTTLDNALPGAAECLVR
jgi:hypothetical protein